MKTDYAPAVAALTRKDPQLRALVRVVGPCTMGWDRTRRPHFAELARMICYQQLAGAAARTIHGRFEALFDGHPTPETVLSVPEVALRGAGLSAAKAASIRDLAVRVDAGEVKLARMGRLPDDEVVRELTLVRGIGRWTAEMFLMFQLGRLDVWPVGDFGVRSGYARLYGLDAMPTAKQLEPLGEPFRPYRSLVAWWCWRTADTVTPD